MSSRKDKSLYQKRYSSIKHFWLLNTILCHCLHSVLCVEILSYSTGFISHCPDPPSDTLKRKMASMAKEGTTLEAQTQLGLLFKDLQGSTFVLPSLEALNPIWKMDDNPFRESIRSDLNLRTNRYVNRSLPLPASKASVFSLKSFIRRWYKDEKIRQKIATLDAEGLSAMAFPRAGREELLNVARLNTWVGDKV